MASVSSYSGSHTHTGIPAILWSNSTSDIGIGDTRTYYSNTINNSTSETYYYNYKDNWYPAHEIKLLRDLEEKIDKCIAFIEIAIKMTTENPKNLQQIMHDIDTLSNKKEDEFITDKEIMI